jgi:hypothetical protein
VRYLKLPWAAEHRTLETRLSPDACRDRLTPLVGSAFSVFSASSTCPVRGSVHGDGFSITKTIQYRNSFQTQASGTYEQRTTGTRIRVRLGFPVVVAAFFTFWMLGVGAFFALSLLALLANLPRSLTLATLASSAPIVLVLGGMLAFGVVLQAFGRWVARDEAEFLLRFLADVLEAHEVPST